MIMEKTLLDTDIFSEILKDKNRNVATMATQYFNIQNLGYDLRMENWKDD